MYNRERCLVKIMAKPQYDWDKIRKEYIEAKSDNLRPTLKELSEKYQVSMNYISKKASVENWKEKAKKFLGEVSIKRQAKNVREYVDTLVNIDSKILDVTEKLLEMIVSDINSIQNGDDARKLSPRDIYNYTESASIISGMMTRMKGDTFGAIDTLAKNNILPENACYQIARVLDNSDENAVEEIAKILRGECPD